MAEYKSLLKSIKKENELNEIILEVAKTVQDPDRLKEILQGINIGKKRRFNQELRICVYYSDDLPTNKNRLTNMTVKEEFAHELDRSDDIFDEIEEIITKKLGIDEVKKEDDNEKSDINKNTFEDFSEEMANLSLESSLKSIVTSHRIIQQSIPDIVVTEDNYEEVLQILNDINEESGSWLAYLMMQKKNRNFTLLDEKFLDLYDETIELAKKSLEMEAAKRKEIETRFKDKIEAKESTAQQVEEQEPVKVKEPAKTTTQVQTTPKTETQSTKNKKPRDAFVERLRQTEDSESRQSVETSRARRKKRLYILEDFVELDKIRNEPKIGEIAAKRILKGYRRIREDDRDKIEEVLNSVSKSGINRTTIMSAAGSLVVGKMLVDLDQSQHAMDRPGGGIFPAPGPHHHGGHEHGHGEGCER